MSIAPMVQLTVLGPQADRDRTLLRLQDLGCLHIDTLAAAQAHLDEGRAQSRGALAFLQATPLRRHAARADEPFDAAAIVRTVQRIEVRQQALEDEKRSLRKRLRVLRPWGHYQLDPDLLARGLRLWFYVVPHWQIDQMPKDLMAWTIVAADARDRWVAVVHPEEPRNMPAPRAHTGSQSLHALEQRMHALHTEQDELQAERVALTRWCNALAHSLNQLDDEAARLCVARQTWVDQDLFALVAWAPASALPALRALADDVGLALWSQAPEPDQIPPTWQVNQGTARAGQALLNVFLTPGYRSWDPSAWVLVAFVLFFGMVMSDAGYACVMALAWGPWAWRRRARRPRPQPADAANATSLAGLLVASTAAWGVLTGTWFGQPMAADPTWAPWVLLDGADVHTMMQLSLGVGVGHLALANLAQARASQGWARLGALGWAAVLLGCAVWGWAIGSAQAAGVTGDLWVTGAQGLTALGLVAVLLSALVPGQGLMARLAALLSTAMRLPGALGDTLSYLRLFALGFAGASLAGAFNDLAQQAREGVPGFGVLLAGLLLLLGHGLNLVLGVAGAFVHGLRLNFIEFLNWSGVEEGRRFVAFQRKDQTPWTPPSP